MHQCPTFNRYGIGRNVLVLARYDVTHRKNVALENAAFTFCIRSHVKHAYTNPTIYRPSAKYGAAQMVLIRSGMEQTRVQASWAASSIAS